MVGLQLRIRFPAALVLVLALSTLLELVAHSQNPITIRSSSSLVLVPVSALDKSGNFVSSLSAQDFQIRIDGKPVEIKNFDIVTEASPSPEVRNAPLPANSFRNISELSVSQSNLVILFIDYLNTRLVDRMGLRTGMLKYLATKMNSDQEIAVYGLTQRLVLLQPFTRDPSPLIAVARDLLKQKGQPRDPTVGKPLIKPGADAISYAKANGSDAAMQFLDALNARKEFNIDQLHRAQRTLEAFRDLAGAFGGISGKKTVIWLTGDVSPLNPSMLYRILVNERSTETVPTPWWEMAKTYDLLNAASISIFPVDIRGIANPGLLSAGEHMSKSEFEQTIRGSRGDDLSSYANPTDLREGEAANALLAMNTVATETGGRVLAGSNDIAELLGQANKLWTSYYVLAFVPEEPKENSAPAYRKISVSVDRKGVKILARHGYVSRPETLISGDAEIQRDLLDAASSPVDLTSVALDLSLRELPGVGRIRHCPFSIKLSSDLLGAVSEKGVTYDLTLAILVLNQDGKFGSPVQKRLRGTVPHAAIPGVKANGMQYDAEFEPPPGGPFFGRVVVRDNLTGRVGTITVALPTTP